MTAPGAAGPIAITRGPSELGKGWLSIPVTAQEDLPAGIAELREVLAAWERGAVRAKNAVREVPAAPGDSPAPTRAAWLAVTSGHTFDVLANHGIAIPAGLKIACVGAATARRSPRTPDLVGPPPATAATLARTLQTRKPDGVIFPCSALASDRLADGLAGVVVHRIELYTTKPAPEKVREMQRANPRAIVVTASSAARALAENWEGSLPPLVAIGEPTASALKELGIVAQVAKRPERASIEDILERILR